MSNYNRIILKERVRIEAGIYAKKSFGEIAEELGRSTSSITREVRQNRIMVKSPYACGTDCVYPPNCRKTGLCGDEYCTKRCWTCTEHDCTQYCDRCVTHTCKKTEKAPFVCDSCSEKNKKACKYNKYYYIAEKAAALSVPYLFLRRRKWRWLALRSVRKGDCLNRVPGRLLIRWNLFLEDKNFAVRVDGQGLPWLHQSLMTDMTLFHAKNIVYSYLFLAPFDDKAVCIKQKYI